MFHHWNFDILNHLKLLISFYFVHVKRNFVWSDLSRSWYRLLFEARFSRLVFWEEESVRRRETGRVWGCPLMVVPWIIVFLFWQVLKNNLFLRRNCNEFLLPPFSNNKTFGDIEHPNHAGHIDEERHFEFYYSLLESFCALTNEPFADANYLIELVEFKLINHNRLHYLCWHLLERKIDVICLIYIQINTCRLYQNLDNCVSLSLKEIRPVCLERVYWLGKESKLWENLCEGV